MKVTRGKVHASQLENARARFEAALGFDSACSVARYQLGAVLAMLGRHEQALEHFETLVQARRQYAFLSRLEADGEGPLLLVASESSDMPQLTNCIKIILSSPKESFVSRQMAPAI